MDPFAEFVAKLALYGREFDQALSPVNKKLATGLGSQIDLQEIQTAVTAGEKYLNILVALEGRISRNTRDW